MEMRIMMLILAFAMLSGCKKAENRTCFKSTGPETERVVELPDFEKLLLREHMKFVLVEDTVNKLVITGGKNMVNLIEWKIDEDKMLEIRNASKCNFLRKLDKKINVEIHYTNMYNIRFEGSDSLTNRDTLHIPYFTLLLRDGSGSVNLRMKSVFINADIAHGWGDYTISGKTEHARIAARSNGYCNVQNLHVRDSVFVSSETSGTIRLNANAIPLRGELKGNGDIWYWGTPTFIKVNELSLGKLVAKP